MSQRDEEKRRWPLPVRLTILALILAFPIVLGNKVILPWMGVDWAVRIGISVGIPIIALATYLIGWRDWLED